MPNRSDKTESVEQEAHGEGAAEMRVPAIRKTAGKRSWWIKTVLMLLLVALSIVLLFTLGDYITGSESKQLSFPELLSAIDYPLFALLLGVVLAYILTESAKYSYLLKVYTGKFRFRTAVKTMFLGKYYDGITPLSTGGQPFQIYYLHKKDIPHGAASAIPVIKYIVSITFLSALSVVLLALAPGYLPQNGIKTMLVLSWISLAINILFPLTIVLFSIFPGVCKKAVAGIVGLLAKLRIVKRREETTEKYIRELTEYSAAIRRFMREIFKFIPLMLLCIVESLLFVTIPFFVVIAVGNIPLGSPEEWIDLLMQIACLVIISRYTALLVPTPGNTGAAEAASSLVFVTVSGIEPVIGWVILFWRFFTYYMYILSGIGISVFEVIRGAVRNRRSEREANKEEA